MIQRNEPISSKDFSKGLVTRDDMFNSNFDQSPNCEDIKWYFDGSIGKRFGTSTTNSVAIVPVTAANTAGWILDTNNSLSTGLQAYWKMDEASGQRNDSVGNLPITDFTGIQSITGLRNQAADLTLARSGLFRVNNSSLSVGSGESFSIHSYIYFEDTANFLTSDQQIYVKNNTAGNTEYALEIAQSGGIQKLRFAVLANTVAFNMTVFANSFGVINTGQWYSVACWNSAGAQIGISVNLSVDTFVYGANTTITVESGGPLTFSGANTSSFVNKFYGRLDELGWWKKTLVAQERSDLYGGGTGNTYTGSQAAGLQFPWYSFDFGAQNLRWVIVAAGTGIMASSNRGATFVNIATSRTLTYQYIQRSKNVLIATSDAYDVPLWWAGSAGTFANSLHNGTGVLFKYSNNYCGFLIGLNSSTSKLGFYYVDENLQLTDTFSSFNIPSSLDDEITGSFILNKFFYVHTRYFIYLLQFVGGNPDWSYFKVRDYGYVARTVKISYLKGQQVAVGLDFDGRVRVFDGSVDTIISDTVENDNNYCDFSLSKISRQGSGLIVSYAEVDTNEQEYRLGLAIGKGSTQTTHHLVLNNRTMAFYPYSNQPYNTMVRAESNNTRVLLAFDRSGFCHIMNSGNLDAGVTPINEVYDSPLIFNKTPVIVSKAHEIDLFFKKTSSGIINYQDRVDMSNIFSKQNPLIELKGTESSILLRRTEDVPSVQNTYQFRITSSGNDTNTADPWKMVRVDYLQQNLGLGKGGA